MGQVLGLEQGLSQPKFGHGSSLFVVSYLEMILREHWNPEPLCEPTSELTSGKLKYQPSGVPSRAPTSGNQEPLGDPTSEPTSEKPKYQPSDVPSLEPTSGDPRHEPVGEPSSEPIFVLLVEQEPRG